MNLVDDGPLDLYTYLVIHSIPYSLVEQPGSKYVDERYPITVCENTTICATKLSEATKDDPNKSKSLWILMLELS